MNGKGKREGRKGRKETGARTENWKGRAQIDLHTVGRHTMIIDLLTSTFDLLTLKLVAETHSFHVRFLASTWGQSLQEIHVYGIIDHIGMRKSNC